MNARVCRSQSLLTVMFSVACAALCVAPLAVLDRLHSPRRRRGATRLEPCEQLGRIIIRDRIPIKPHQPHQIDPSPRTPRDGLRPRVVRAESEDSKTPDLAA